MRDLSGFIYFIYLFVIFFHISHLGTYHGNGKCHFQYTSGNLQMV